MEELISLVVQIFSRCVSLRMVAKVLHDLLAEQPLDKG